MGAIANLRRYLRYRKNVAYEIWRAEHTRQALLSEIPGVASERSCDKEVIVSLTTYGTRLGEVFLAIESIMQGSVKPDRIILWLQDDYEGRPLPKTLENQKRRGLEVCYCRDIRSYKKLIPTLRLFPEAVIITIDDDAIYAFDLVENLISAYKEDPKGIYAGRMHRMRVGRDGKPLSYKRWQWRAPDFEFNPLNFFTGVGGVLYPPHSLDPEVLNEEVFMSICGHADDIWLNAMALKNGTLSRRVYAHDSKGEDYMLNADAQSSSLASFNVSRGGNDIQLRAVFDRYDLDKLLAGER